jgi:hypothetical protein
MGFFDRIKKLEDEEEEGSEPVEDGATNKMVAAATRAVPPPPPPPTVAVKAVPPPPPAPDREPEDEAAKPFGIEEAIQLVRQLPSRSTELVMQVVKKTLESVGVDLVKIIEAANDKETSIEKKIGGLRGKIDDLEAQIAGHKKEIAALEAEQREVSMVKERLLLAQRVDVEGGVSTPPRAVPPVAPPTSVSSPNAPLPPPPSLLAKS